MTGNLTVEDHGLSLTMLIRMRVKRGWLSGDIQLNFDITDDQNGDGDNTIYSDSGYKIRCVDTHSICI